jgi:NAD(P)-dependent dehydrogenase (short-subunit alcohol dehydrogenase family)
MDLELKNKNVLIAGGSKGIGLACARLFLREGARVAIVSRSPGNLEAAKKTLGDCYCISADLTDAAAAAAMVAQVETDFGPLDVLVNCAGAAQKTDAVNLTPEAWRAAMDAKYFSYINVMDPVIKRMAARGQGAIVNVIGSGGKVAAPTHLAGGAANAALMLVTAGLAQVYAAHGVRVVGISPGLTNTGRVVQSLQAEAMRDGISEQEVLNRSIAKMPLGRMAEPEEIADIVAFAASGRGLYLTGANITVDGACTPSVV